MLANNHLITDKLKNVTDIERMISFFEDGRVLTLTDAVNLCFDEKRKDDEAAREAEHRERMEALAEKEAEYARRTAIASEKAAEEAEQARRIAEDNEEKLRSMDDSTY